MRTPTIAAALALASPLAAARPRLVVVVSVDQLSADLVARYGPQWTGGLGRLEREGVWFAETYHDHAFTETGPGHAVLLSGRTPGHTGILENHWYDAATGRMVYCVSDEKTRLVGIPERTGASNQAFIGDALGDWLQAQVPGSRAFALAGKDRASVLMAGRRPTAAYWFEGPYGFTTSTHYAQALPPWLEVFNGGLRGRFRRQSWVWKPLRSYEGESRVATFSFPDGSSTANGHFPRLVNTVGMPVDADFASRLRASPFYDQVVLEAARALVEGEQLGRGKGTDLLALGLSGTDYVGHSFGPGSQEMQDQLQRLDQHLGAFLDWLRARVPEAWVVLTSDHGGMDLPEALQAQGFAARRIDPRAWLGTVSEKVREGLGLSQEPILPDSEPNQLFLNPHATEGTSVTRSQVVKALVAQLKAMPEVLEVATAEQVMAFQEPKDLGSPRDNAILARLKHSFNPTRSGEILVVFKPLVIEAVAGPAYVATHGSPHDYDRQVPMIFWGPWKPAVRTEPVRTLDLAPTLARELGLTPPADLDGKALTLE